MRHPAPRPHARALRACLAVTLGGAACTSRAAESDERDDDTPPAATGEATLPITATPVGEGSAAGASGALDEGGAPDEGSAPPILIPRPAPDAALPELAAPDAGSDTEAKCSAERDGQCPATCDRNTDIDCCEGQGSPGAGLCQFVPDFGCQCAVIGPFNPPETPT